MLKTRWMRRDLKRNPHAIFLKYAFEEQKQKAVPILQMRLKQA